MKPRLIIEQKLTALTNKYSVYEATAEGKKGDLVAFAQQKKLAFKEKVEFFTDTQKTELRFVLQAEKALDIHGKFFVLDAQGNQLGQFRKEFTQSLVASTWSVLDDTDKPVLQISESSVALAVTRRYIGFIPIIGEFVELGTSLIRYHFNLTNPATKAQVGSYRKITRFYDRYALSVDDATWNANKPEVFAAVAVALDALQGR